MASIGAQIKIVANGYAVTLSFEEAATVRDFLIKILPVKPKKKKS